MTYLKKLRVFIVSGLLLVSASSIAEDYVEQWKQGLSGSMLKYVTDAGEQGVFPLYLQNNGRVNIGGTAFAVQQGGAGC